MQALLVFISTSLLFCLGCDRSHTVPYPQTVDAKHPAEFIGRWNMKNIPDVYSVKMEFHLKVGAPSTLNTNELIQWHYLDNKLHITDSSGSINIFPVISVSKSDLILSNPASKGLPKNLEEAGQLKFERILD